MIRQIGTVVALVVVLAACTKSKPPEVTPEEKAKLQSAINTGATTLGFSQPFDVDDAQLLSKFNRQLAGGQAKDVAGSIKEH